MTATWDAVQHATSYIVYIYKDSAYGSYWFSEETENTYIDYSADVRFFSDITYYFKVYAESEVNPESDAAISDGKTGWNVRGNMTGVSLSPEGILSWNPYPGAEDYGFTLFTGGGSTSNQTSIDLRHYAELWGCEEGETYDYSIYATINVDGMRIEFSKRYNGTYTYTKQTQILGDINKDSATNIIDVKLLLQKVIANTSGSWTEDEIAVGDMNKDSRINIIDVRLLLQKVISGE